MRYKIIGIIAGIVLVLGIAVFFLTTDKALKETLNDPDPVVVKWARLFDPSVLSFDDRIDELSWFRKKAEPFRGMTITSVGEDIETSFWESQYLTKAFEQITGIHVQHDVIGEKDVVIRLMEQTEKGKNHYDIYVTDADLIGTHIRSRKIVVLSDYMAGPGKEYTNPGLDLDDFLNLQPGQDYEGNLLQIPDYQFIMLYWFRHDWFTDPTIMAEFKVTFGYDLGVPQNWSAYEDIAKFFTGRQMKNPNGSVVTAYGHADYGLPGPWLGWRFSDAFMAIAGMGDTGIPNGLPVDEWGIRVENKIPVGASVERGGSINGPAAVYGLTKWLEFLHKYAPEESKQVDWLGLGPLLARGDIAQTWYWTQPYASLNPEYNKAGSPICDKDGFPVWRVAPMPRGRYWQEGMKMGYMDSGSWTIPESTKGDRRRAAWLWAQFSMSKTVALKKFDAGITPVRRSTLYSVAATKKQKQLGGLIEFLRAPDIKKFTDSGPNVPHYPKMSTLWWRNIANAISGKRKPQQALDDLAEQLDILIGSLQQASYSPKLNPKKSREYWLNQPGSPKPERLERDPPRTRPYAELLKEWGAATQ